MTNQVKLIELQVDPNPASPIPTVENEDDSLVCDAHANDKFMTLVNSVTKFGVMK